MNYDVFLSHNSKDKPSVEEIDRKLQETYSLKCWLDKWNLVPGEPWQEALLDALDDCQMVAVFVGPNIISPWENEGMRSAGEITFGLDDPKVTTSIQNLGLVLKDMGNYGEAKDVFKRILKINEKAFGLNHPNVTTIINNLGLVLEVLGDHIGAKNAYNRAIRIGKTTFGPDYPQVAIYTNNLGLVLKDLGDLANAKAAFERALEISEVNFMSDHPSNARNFNNLSSVLNDVGDYAGAKAACERALNILRQFLPEGHPNIKIVEENLRIFEEKMKSS